MEEYIMQPNLISQSFHKCSSYAKKLIYMSIGLFPSVLNKTVNFSIHSFLYTMGIKNGTRQKECIISAAMECNNNLPIIINQRDKFIATHWFEKVYIDFENNMIYMTFSEIMYNLLSYMVNRNKKDVPVIMPPIGYNGETKIYLYDISKLQSFYAIRWYELALSYSGFSGKDNNKTDEWYFIRSVDEIKNMFSLKNVELRDLKKRVIYDPVEDINYKNLICKIEVDIIKNGKSIEGFFFKCKKNSIKELDNGLNNINNKNEKIKNILSLEEKQNEYLLEKYYEDFKRIYDEEMEKENIPYELKNTFIYKMSIRHKALEKLRMEKGVQYGQSL